MTTALHAPQLPHRLACHPPSPHGESVWAPGVLVVDDEEPIRLVLNYYLRHRNLRVWTAAGAAEALTLFHAHREKIDVVLTDMHMPGMGGLELVHRLRTLRPGLPCFVMTGCADPAVIHEFRAGSVARIIDKPFNLALVADILTGSVGCRVGK